MVVTIPCLNEEMTVERVIAAIPRELEGATVQVLVIDDGSTDETSLRAERAGATVHRHRVNLGLGRAFRSGIETALAMGADVVVNIDGDGQFDPTDIPLIAGPVLRGEADMATGSRFMLPELVPVMPTVKKWGNRWVAQIVWLLSGERFSDVSCGFRAFSREALLRMNLFGSFTYTQETFLDLLFKDRTILEVPVKVRGTREFGTSRVASSIPRYARRSLGIMLRAFIGYRPLAFFTVIALVFAGSALSMLGFLAAHYAQTGSFSPHIWAGFIGGSFAFLAIITLVLGILADMLVRIRLNQEELLYRMKKKHLKQAHLSIENPAPTSQS